MRVARLVSNVLLLALCGPALAQAGADARSASGEAGRPVPVGEAAAAASGALGIEATSERRGQPLASVNVAVLEDAPPFSFTGRFGVRTGFDVELAYALCEALQVRCTLVPTAQEDLSAALHERRVAWAIATPVLTAEAEGAVTVTGPYARLTVRYVVPSATGRDVEDDDLVYGAVIGTAQARYLRETFPRPEAVRLYPNGDGLWIDLALDRLDAVLAPAIVARLEFLSTPIGEGFGFEPLASGGDAKLGRSAVVAVRERDEELLRRLNAALGTMAADGALAEIARQYLDQDLLTPPVTSGGGG
ncbi:transporter substrate-binding domain-containing protein [Acuticoccus sp.]|uniref:transporter substrate-binding domain-containing protein n=1 Tax=Acuticoccus sp. TaxID=1904378 RepID=UPI003B52C117